MKRAPIAPTFVSRLRIPRLRGQKKRRGAFRLLTAPPVLRFLKMSRGTLTLEVIGLFPTLLGPAASIRLAGATSANRSLTWPGPQSHPQHPKIENGVHPDEPCSQTVKTVAWGRETAQRVKCCLPCQHEDLTLDPQHHTKGFAVAACPVIPLLAEEAGRSQERIGYLV